MNDMILYGQDALKHASEWLDRGEVGMAADYLIEAKDCLECYGGYLKDANSKPLNNDAYVSLSRRLARLDRRLVDIQAVGERMTTKPEHMTQAEYDSAIAEDAAYAANELSRRDYDRAFYAASSAWWIAYGDASGRRLRALP